MPGSKHLLIEFGIHHTLESFNLLKNFLNMVRVQVNSGTPVQRSLSKKLFEGLRVTFRSP